MNVSIYGTCFEALLDSGATHSFMSPKVVEQLGLSLKSPGSRVTLADGRVALSSGRALGVFVRVEEGGTQVVDFVILPIKDYEVVLGMDWLRAVNPVVDWRTADIKFNPVSGVEEEGASSSIVDEDKQDLSSYRGESDEVAEFQVISSRQFERLVRQGKVEAMVLGAAVSSPNDEVVSEVARLREEFSDVFIDDLPPGLPPERMVEHAIEVVPGSEPPHRPPYRMSEVELQELKKQLEELKSKGLIQPSNSSYAAPVLFVKKKDGTWRMVVDYRGLNRITVKYRYPIPRIDDLLDRLRGAKVFSLIDLKSGYHQLRIKKEDRHKTAFVTRLGAFEFLTMPFGLTNAPASFSRLMNEVFGDVLDDFVVLYLDDILIFSKNNTDHKRHLRVVLERLRQHKLYANKEKCHLCQDRVEFLGHVISADGISVDASKAKAIQDWPTPKTVRDVRAFLGVTGWFRRFIHRYAHKALPLTNLTKDKVKFEWGLEAEQAFQDLKAALVSPEVLQVPDPTKSFILRTDASDVAIGAVLLQDQGHGVKPCAYLSRKLQPAERNYSTYDKECLAIFYALEAWSIYLEGNTFTLETDQAAIEFLQSQKRLSRRQARWMEVLQSYDCTIRHIRGVDNVIADGLSRRADHYDEESTVALSALSTISYDDSVLEDIKRGYETDNYFKEILDALRDEQSTKTPHRVQRFNYERGLLWFVESEERRLCIPRNLELRCKLLQQGHDSPQAGHQGVDRTYAVMRRQFFWPRMSKDVKRFVRSCHACQVSKPTNKSQGGLLHPLPIPKRRWGTVTMDFVVGLPISPEGWDAAVVFCCKLSKMVHLIPVKSTITAEEVADVYLHKVYSLHGLADEFISDRDSKFTSDFWQRVTSKLEIKLKMSTAHRAQTDGQSERAIRTLKDALRSLCNYRQDNWVELLPYLEFAFNNAPSTSSGHSPFFLNYGFHPKALPSVVSTLDPLVSPGSSLDISRFLERLDAALTEVQDALRDAQDSQEQYANRSRRVVRFAVDDMVLLSTRYLMDDVNASRPNRKLAPKWMGPFQVTAVLPGDTYQLELPSNFRAHPIFHVSMLKPYHPSPDEFAGRAPLPTPLIFDDVADEWVYGVDCILAHRRRYRRNEYLVKWTNRPESEASWLPECDVGRPLIEAYEDSRASLPIPSRRRGRPRAKGGRV